MADPQTLTVTDYKPLTVVSATPLRSDVQVVGRVRSDNPSEEVQEPTTWWGGFSKSLLDQMGVGNQDSPISHAAQPQTATDVASLLLPNAGDFAGAAGAAARALIPQALQRPAVVRAVGDEIPVINRVLRIKDKIAAINDAAKANTGGRLVPGSALSDEQAMANALSELREPSTPNAVSLGPQAELPPGYTPRTSIPRIVSINGTKVAVASPSGAASMEAAAPAVDARISGLAPTTPNRPTFPDPVQAAYSRVLQNGGGTPSAIPSLEDLKATMPSPESADTPRDWSSGVTDPAAKARMQAAHKVLMDDDARYRGATSGERQLFQTMPQTAKDALIQALLTGGGGE
jgi:hypothetical protein